MMDEIPHGEITEVEDVSVPKIAHGEVTEVEDDSVPKMAQGEITEVEDDLVPRVSHGEITEPEDVSVPETSKDVDPRSSDLILTLNRLNKLLEALLPAEVNPFKATEDEKSRVSAGGSDVHHMPTSDATVARCSCQIDSVVEKEWKNHLVSRNSVFPHGNSIKLMGLLKRYPCLLAISAHQGNTVLHVAAREGKLNLLVYICSLFLDDHGKAVEEYVHGDIKIDRKIFFKKQMMIK